MRWVVEIFQYNSFCVAKRSLSYTILHHHKMSHIKNIKVISYNGYYNTVSQIIETNKATVIR